MNIELYKFQGRCRSNVALLGVSVLPLYTSLSVYNRNTSLPAQYERNAEMFPTLPSKDLSGSIRYKTRLSTNNITQEKYKKVRIHPTIKNRGLSAQEVCKDTEYFTKTIKYEIKEVK